MALSDYYLCDVCEAKTIYTADTDIDLVGCMAVLCWRCAETRDVVVRENGPENSAQQTPSDFDERDLPEADMHNPLTDEWCNEYAPTPYKQLLKETIAGELARRGYAPNPTPLVNPCQTVTASPNFCEFENSAQQEPVAWGRVYMGKVVSVSMELPPYYGGSPKHIPLYSTPPDVQQAIDAALEHVALKLEGYEKHDAAAVVRASMGSDPLALLTARLDREA